jgi:hypothetical protein
MPETKQFKPNFAFLLKVEAGVVRMVKSYSMNRGGYYEFKGGAISYNKHLSAGFVKPYGSASLGRPAVVELTDEGRAALALARGEK